MVLYLNKSLISNLYPCFLSLDISPIAFMESPPKSKKTMIYS